MPVTIPESWRVEVYILQFKEYSVLLVLSRECKLKISRCVMGQTRKRKVSRLWFCTEVILMNLMNRAMTEELDRLPGMRTALAPHVGLYGYCESKWEGVFSAVRGWWGLGGEGTKYTQLGWPAFWRFVWGLPRTWVYWCFCEHSPQWESYLKCDLVVLFSKWGPGLDQAFSAYGIVGLCEPPPPSRS